MTPLMELTRFMTVPGRCCSLAVLGSQVPTPDSDSDADSDTTVLAGSIGIQVLAPWVRV